MVRRMHSTLPFDRGVWTEHPQDDPIRGKKVQEEALSNSRPLSHWMTLMVRPNCMKTKAKKLDKVGKVSDFKGKVHTK
jgi:hypothetical protein